MGMQPLVVLLFLCFSAFALDNGLGRTPQMGYNSWYDLFMAPSEGAIKEIVQALKSTGLYAAGYRYVNLDDGIIGSRDSHGQLVADPKFPSGFKSLADYIHSNGMLFGVYTDRGPKTCGGRPSAEGHEVQDAMTYASWGVDYVKEDSCNAPSDHQTAFLQYSKMRDALNATKRPIFFSLCGWNDWYAPVGQALGNSWRTGPDDSNWPGVLGNIDIITTLWTYSGPGGWNDPCLLLGRDSSGKAAITDLQGRAQFTMWAIMASPLLLSQNIRNLTGYQLETYLNREAIAINQDPLGKQGQKLVGGPLSSGPHRANIWGRPLKDGKWALGFVNAEPSTDFTLTCDAECFKVTGWDSDQKLRVYDVWAKKNLPSTTPKNGISVRIEANGGSALLVVEPYWS